MGGAGGRPCLRAAQPSQHLARVRQFDADRTPPMSWFPTPLSSLSLLIVVVPQFVDYGDLSYLHRGVYEAALRAEIAAAEPFEFTYRRGAPKPQVWGG